MNPNKLYIFNSKIVTHVLFWVLYYIFFSFIWAGHQGLQASFFLEFILLPIRIMSVYVTIYYLLPKFLIERKFYRFILGYAALILVAAVLQRIFIHMFYENLMDNDTAEGLFSFKMLLRAAILINTTVFFVLSLKIFQLFLIEKDKNAKHSLDYLEVKADRRIHRISLKELVFIEGQGNYTTYHFTDASKLTAYGSIKKALETLPRQFVRVHKSYIVNKEKIKSFDANSVEVKNQIIPRGKGLEDSALTLN